MAESVIIPAYGRRELTEAAVAAVRRTTDSEIVIVDNDGNADGVDCDRYLHNRRNRGFATACNQGAWIASGDVLVFLNNDTEVQPGWLEPLALHARAGAIVGAKLTYPDGSIQHAGVRIYRDNRHLLWAENLKVDGPSRPVDAVTGACLAASRVLFAACGGFDSGYWNGYEDVDLCLAARSLGVPCIYEPASLVVHYESQAGPERWSGVRANIHRLQEKWGSCGDY